MGLNTAATVNTSIGAPKEPKSPLDFMPSRWRNRPPAPKRMNHQRFARNVRAALLPFSTPAP